MPCAPGYARAMTTTTARPTATRLRAASLAAVLGIGAISGVAACSDEDGE